MCICIYMYTAIYIYINIYIHINDRYLQLYTDITVNMYALKKYIYIYIYTHRQPAATALRWWRRGSLHCRQQCGWWPLVRGSGSLDFILGLYLYICMYIYIYIYKSIFGWKPCHHVNPLH